MNKSRQLGLSTTISIETCHAACTRRNYAANIVSTREDEARDKLKVADMLYESIDERFIEYGLRPDKYRNAEDELAFHFPPFTSSIVSKPATSGIRGGSKDMYYDEAAHIREFQKLWQAGVPAMVRGDRRVTVISTPLGQSGLYYNIINDINAYSNFSRHVIPWWESRFFVKGGQGSPDAVTEAMNLAPLMSTTEERLRRFGNESINDQLTLLGGDIQIFQTEFECLFVDETDAYYPYELVRSAVDESLHVYTGGTLPVKRDYDGEISIGVDLAKERDKTVFTVVVHSKKEDGSPFRTVIFVKESSDDYGEQFKELRSIVNHFEARRVSIDATGPGAGFAERAKNGELYSPGTNVEPVTFTNAIKEKWATTFKGELQTGSVKYANYGKLVQQIHGTKRTRTESGMFKFAGRQDDYMWSLMLALYGENRRPVSFHVVGGN